MDLITATWTWMAAHPWLPVALAVEAVAAAGVIGYLLGRRTRT